MRVCFSLLLLALPQGARSFRSARVSARQGASWTLWTGKSRFDESSSVVKDVVSGLTGLLNAVFPAQEHALAAQGNVSLPLSREALVQELVADFRRGYLFTGDINFALYDADCLFTDPTLSFRGLRTFARNIQSLRPLLDAVLGRRVVVLHRLVSADDQRVTATWSMWGALRLPWRPCIELSGITTYTYDASRGGRIVDYFEQWTIPPSTALLQLLRPGRVPPVDEAGSASVGMVIAEVLDQIFNAELTGDSSAAAELKLLAYSQRNISPLEGRRTWSIARSKHPDLPVSAVVALEEIHRSEGEADGDKWLRMITTRAVGGSPDCSHAMNVQSAYAQLLYYDEDQLLCTYDGYPVLLRATSHA